MDSTYLRAARELLRWDQKRLAAEAKVGISTVRRFELGQTVGDDKVAAMVGALERDGVLFIDATALNGVEVAGALGLRPWARPQGRVDKLTYDYTKNGKVPGRPKSS